MSIIVSSTTPKFTPPSGRTLFIIGQDNDAIGEYLTAIPSPHPGGVTSFTSLNRLEGTTSKANYGSGNLFLDVLVEKHPESVIALGISLVDYLPALPSGQADHKIDTLLDLLVSYDRPVFLLFGVEFDGEWNHYDPEEFKQGWISFRNRMQERGITNVAMVWQSATYCEGTYQQMPMEAWYPGDEHVDWVALSFFVQAECGYGLLDEMLEFGRAHNKPVMIAEAAPQCYETGKLTYTELGRDFDPRTAEHIWDSQSIWGKPHPNGYWGDSRVQANDLIKTRWLTELNQATWLMTGPALFSTLRYLK